LKGNNIFQQQKANTMKTKTLEQLFEEVTDTVVSAAALLPGMLSVFNEPNFYAIVGLESSPQTTSVFADTPKFTQGDFDRFVAYLGEQDVQPGHAYHSAASFFLTGMGMHTEETDVYLDVNSLQHPLNCLAVRSEINVHVAGNLGYMTGMHMTTGKLHVDGNVLDGLGYKMQGGSIHVTGTAGKRTGTEMTGGLIEIRGNTQSIGYVRRGRIECHGDNKPEVDTSLPESATVLFNGKPIHYGGEGMSDKSHYKGL